MADSQRGNRAEDDFAELRVAMDRELLSKVQLMEGELSHLKHTIFGPTGQNGLYGFSKKVEEQLERVMREQAAIATELKDGQAKIARDLAAKTQESKDEMNTRFDQIQDAQGERRFKTYQLVVAAVTGVGGLLLGFYAMLKGLAPPQ